jgi:hypothetical protein
VKPYKPKPGEWVHLAPKVRWTCCDCGLTHLHEFRVRPDGGIEMRGRRDERATMTRRKSRSRAKL